MIKPANFWEKKHCLFSQSIYQFIEEEKFLSQFSSRRLILLSCILSKTTFPWIDLICRNNSWPYTTMKTTAEIVALFDEIELMADKVINPQKTNDIRPEIGTAFGSYNLIYRNAVIYNQYMKLKESVGKEILDNCNILSQFPHTTYQVIAGLSTLLLYATANSSRFPQDKIFELHWQNLQQQNELMSLFLPLENWKSQYHTTNTTQLAKTIYETKNWELCPILADALQDAGCDDEYTLNLLLDHHQQFARGVWLIDQLTGKI